jgi:hypothetical protein
LFFYWKTDRVIGEQPLIWFTIWACCLQTSPENFIIWIGLVKLFQIIYRRRTMSKLTAQQIDDRVERVLASLHSALDRGEITEAQLELVMGDRARWSAEKYAKLPQAQAVDAIMGLLLGQKK